MLQANVAEETTLSAHPDQAVALQQRRLPDPLVARDQSVEFAGRRLWHCGRLREAAGAWAGRRHRHRSDGRDQHAHRRRGVAGPLSAARQLRSGRAHRRTVPNQYPRALDIARPFPSGWSFRSPSAASTFRAACRCWMAALSISTRAGIWALPCSAARPRAGFDTLLTDAAAGRLKPMYNFMKDLPGIEGTPRSIPSRQFVERTLGQSSSFDAGRGCPYQCSFCTIINVQGRKSRYRSADDIEQLVRLNWAQGIPQVFHHRRQFCAQPGVEIDLRSSGSSCVKRQAFPSVC